MEVQDRIKKNEIEPLPEWVIVITKLIEEKEKKRNGDLGKRKY